MKFWVDAQLPPQLAVWLRANFEVECYSLRDLGLRDANDLQIFRRAKIEADVIISKDSDFIDLVSQFDTPPQILWVTCGNVTNRALKRIFIDAFPQALILLQAGEKIVEIGD